MVWAIVLYVGMYAQLKVIDFLGVWKLGGNCIICVFGFVLGFFRIDLGGALFIFV